MVRSIVQKMTPVAVAVLFGILYVYWGIQSFKLGGARSEWLPQATFGMLFTLFVISYAFAVWYDEAPTETFGLSGWVLVLAFSSWVVAGLTFFAVSYATRYTWILTGVGTVGLGFAIYLNYQLS